MSANRKPNAATDIYRQHLQGTPYANNPASNRLALIERMYQRVITELAVNRFKWTGMPGSIDLRFMEMTLFRRALSVFYKDTTYDKFFALEGAGTAFVNMMHNPTGYTVLGPNFGGKTLSAYKYEASEDKDQTKAAIPIWANSMRIPDLDIVMLYSYRLAEMDRTIEINSKNARRNKVIITPENTKLSAVNINRALDEGQDGIQVAGPMQDMAFIQAVDMGINVTDVEKMHIIRTRMWSECMGLLGIDNANQDKKERLVAAEVDANNDQTSMMRYVNLNARRTAADQINEVFGLNVEVEYFTDVDKMAATVPEEGVNTD
jgi:hypothetical protein